MNFVTDCVVEPPWHIPADKFDWSHSPDLVGIRLPQRTVERSARFIASRLDCFGNLELLELRHGQAPTVQDHWLSGIAIDHATGVRPRPRHAIRMAPEISQLRSFAAHDKQCGTSAERCPP